MRGAHGGFRHRTFDKTGGAMKVAIVVLADSERHEGLGSRPLGVDA